MRYLLFCFLLLLLPSCVSKPHNNNGAAYNLSNNKAEISFDNIVIIGQPGNTAWGGGDYSSHPSYRILLFNDDGKGCIYDVDKNIIYDLAIINKKSAGLIAKRDIGAESYEFFKWLAAGITNGSIMDKTDSALYRKFDGYHLRLSFLHRVNGRWTGFETNHLEESLNSSTTSYELTYIWPQLDQKSYTKYQARTISESEEYLINLTDDILNDNLTEYVSSGDFISVAYLNASLKYFTGKDSPDLFLNHDLKPYVNNFIVSSTINPGGYYYLLDSDEYISYTALCRCLKTLVDKSSQGKETGSEIRFIPLFFKYADDKQRKVLYKALSRFCDTEIIKSIKKQLDMMPEKHDISEGFKGTGCFGDTVIRR